MTRGPKPNPRKQIRAKVDKKPPLFLLQCKNPLHRITINITPSVKTNLSLFSSIRSKPWESTEAAKASQKPHVNDEADEPTPTTQTPTRRPHPTPTARGGVAASGAAIPTIPTAMTAGRGRGRPLRRRSRMTTSQSTLPRELRRRYRLLGFNCFSLFSFLFRVFPFFRVCVFVVVLKFGALFSGA